MAAKKHEKLKKNRYQFLFASSVLFCGNYLIALLRRYSYRGLNVVLPFAAASTADLENGKTAGVPEFHNSN